uniref:palmitoyl-protein hydrolase n=1 Tax=Lygus hesperus TaxID=30085 RepID=A0A146MFX3_LYGHE
MNHKFLGVQHIIFCRDIIWSFRKILPHRGARSTILPFRTMGYSSSDEEGAQTCHFGELNAIKQVVTTDQLNPEATGALILMHGTGDNAKCFSRMINYLMGQKAAFPHIRIIYPTAPFTPYTPALGVPTTTWFDISNYTMDAVENEDNINRVGQDLLRIIDSQVKCGIPRNRIAVGGFSRGGAMAFHLGFNLAPDIAAVGVMSSWIPYSSVIYKFLRERSPSQKLPVLLQQHGEYDEMVNISEGRTTFEELKKLGVQGKFLTLPRQGHVVSKKEIEDLFQFVSELIPVQQGI